MTPVSQHISATYRVLNFIVVFRNRFYIIHQTLESNRTRSSLDIMDFIDLFSHRYHGFHDTSQSRRFHGFT